LIENKLLDSKNKCLNIYKHYNNINIKYNSLINNIENFKNEKYIEINNLKGKIDKLNDII